MNKLGILGRALSLVLACGLIALVEWHEELKSFAADHRDLIFFLGVALLLTIPARFIALAAAYLVELLFVGWSRSSAKLLLQPRASVKLDVLAIVVTLLFPIRHLGYVLSFGLLFVTDLYAQQHFDISFTRFLPLWIAQIVCFVLFQSCLQYWLHRLEHAVPALWALHKFHHSADRMSILTSARQTQFTRGVEQSLVLIPAGLITAPTAALPVTGSPFFLAVVVYFAYEALILVNGYLCHSNLNTGYGWLGRWFIVSPRMHRLHHATSPAYHDRNFSFDLVIWDRLFGTYAVCPEGKDVRDIPVGLDDNPFNSRGDLGGVLRDYFITPYLVFWREIRKGLIACMPGRASFRAKAS